MAEADDDFTGDDPEEEPADPHPDPTVHFGDDKITAKELKAAPRETVHHLWGAIDALALRIQNGNVDKASAYVLCKLVHEVFNLTKGLPETNGALIRVLGLSGAQAAKGKRVSLLPPDPTREMPPVKVVAGP